MRRGEETVSAADREGAFGLGNRKSHLTLRVGEEHELGLTGLATAGYQWSCDVEGTRDALAVSKLPGARDRPDPSEVGTSADEVFRITALRPGAATLRFEQRRRWEKDTPPLNTHVVDVEVLS
jgi:predicted secreted protein